jgi:hypothetical protein
MTEVTAEKLKQTTADVVAKLKNASLNHLLYAMLAFFVIVIVYYAIYYSTLRERSCRFSSTVYGELNSRIRSATTDPSKNTYALRDFYLKSAYNVCAGSNYRLGYVDLCHLKAALRMGCRGLDLELFSVDDSPVIACSTSDSYHVKESFNSIPFHDFMETLSNNAFRSSTAPNFDDPILLHMRIKSSNLAMYERLAAILESYSDLLLGKEYSYENGGENLGTIPLASLRRKIVIIVDASNTTYLDSDAFYEYVNMTSSSVFMRALRYYDVKYAPDLAELIGFNKRGMTVVLPDEGANPSNPVGNVMRETGCQLQAMRYSHLDTQVEENDVFYDEAGFAFVLKPEPLRYIPVMVKAPEPQRPELSYETRVVESDYYKFDI